MEYRVITHDFWHEPFGGGFDLAEDPDVSRIGYETSTLVFRPEKVVKEDCIILVPGIGINKKTVQGSFTNIAEKIAECLGATTAVTLEGPWDGVALAGFPETGIAVALRSTLKELGPKKVHLVGFSHNSTNLLTVSSFKDIAPKVKSITLVAPTDSPYSIVKIFKDGGRKVEVKDDKTTIGNRRTLVPSIISNGTVTPAKLFETKLVGAVELLKERGIPITILHGGKHDTIVSPKISKKLADDLGLDTIFVKPDKADQGNEYTVHNFGSRSQLEFLITVLNKNII